jgi:hypothetical protein
MSESSKIEFEELLNAVVDDEATERQKTELKRLAKHDPNIERQLESLRRQKKLINASPIESAPKGLVEDVISVLERRLILGDSISPERTVTGTSHLMMRRLLTTAAMLLLPLGLLSFVIYQIMKPASTGPIDYVSTNKILSQSGSSELAVSSIPMVVRQLPFDGILTFRTNQQMTVSNFTEKMIFDLGLMRSTVPSREVDVTTYQITTSPERVAKLMDSLQGVWPRCQQVTLNVIDGSEEDNTIDIVDVHAEQVKSLASEEDREIMGVMAKQYALSNKNKDSVFAMTEGSRNGSDSAPDDYPPLTMPILTGRNEADPQSDQPVDTTVQLRIHIVRATE